LNEIHEKELVDQEIRNCTYRNNNAEEKIIMRNLIRIQERD
jgi:hypothetical protein